MRAHTGPVIAIGQAEKRSQVRAALPGWVQSRDPFAETFRRDGWTVRYEPLPDRIEVTGPDTSLVWGGIRPAGLPGLLAAIGGPAPTGGAGVGVAA